MALLYDLIKIGIVNYENIPATTIKYGKEILDKIEKLEKAIEIKK